MAKRTNKSRAVSKAKPAQPTTKKLSIAKIKCSQDVQPRLKTDENIVKEYAERIEAGDDLPKIVVFFDGTTYWLAEGFHRLAAYKKARPQADRVHRHRRHQGRRSVGAFNPTRRTACAAERGQERAVEMALEHPNGKVCPAGKSPSWSACRPRWWRSIGRRSKRLPTVDSRRSERAATGRTIKVGKIGKNKKGNGKSSGKSPAKPATSRTARPKGAHAPDRA